MIKLKLPYPPSANHYWGVKGKIRFVGKKGIEFRQNVKIIALQHTQSPLNERLHMEVYLYPPDKRKRDVDNVLKPLLDALEHANVYENDSQIDKLCVTRMEVAKEGYCEVVIQELIYSPDH